MTDYERINRFLLAGGIAVLGVLVASVGDSYINTPAHVLFFNEVPRWVVALAHIAAAGMLLGPVASDSFRRGLSVFGIHVVAGTWAAVALYPATQGKIANVVSVCAWLLVGICAQRMVLPEGLRRVQQDV